METKTYNLTKRQESHLENMAISAAFHLEEWTPGTSFEEVRDGIDGTGIDHLASHAMALMSVSGFQPTISHDKVCLYLWGQTYNTLIDEYGEYCED